jgi:uroporphyrin-III C-methyltransferase
MSPSGVFTADRRGRVYLVGAGPGDPELLTVRAHRLVTTAKVVAYDALVSPEILALIPDTAERLAVGRRKGTDPDAPAVHPIVLDKVLRGIDVVRLKGGDPYVFGRGGEEAEQLAELDVAVEIVPGISAAFGAAATMGIPLTHRDVSAGITLATAHTRHDADAGPPIGARVPSEGTVVLYMGRSTLRETAAALIEAGRSPSTPAAVVARATLPSQRSVVADLATIADAAERAELDTPAIVIVGEVVARRVTVRTPAVSVITDVRSL